MLKPGLVVEVSPGEATLDVGGATVEAAVVWHDGKVVIDRLTVHRNAAETIDTTLLRSISLPALLAAAASEAVKVWVDDAGTEPVDLRQLPNESLEAWAARLAIVATLTHRSAAEYVAQVQGIKPSSANQRLVTARKMGLLDINVATKADKKKKGKR